MSKKIFKPCSHTQSNTQSPNPIFKIPIYCTKYTQNAKILSKNCKTKKQTFNFLFCYIYKLHNSYFAYFVYFWIWWILVILYLYICVPARRCCFRGVGSISKPNDSALAAPVPECPLAAPVPEGECPFDDSSLDVEGLHAQALT